ncbi:unnamed protein product [Trifolium pratense]|uniref:Uncharacterized protein n=1 Tax=Trifolium pratense TaxID=57577 RepID=A0ACB0L4N2_TRIPR|nr:unnamed protein product [Trifolium pratense]
MLESALISTEEDSWIYRLCNGDVSRRRNVVGIWERLTPLKVVVFSWQAFLGRLLTRQNLAISGVIPGDGKEGYPFCNLVLESFLLWQFA